MLQVVLGDISYPKSTLLVLPSTGIGISLGETTDIVVAAGGKIILKEAKRVVSERGKNYVPGEFFLTRPGRMKRRGVQAICHAVLAKHPQDYTSVLIIKAAIRSIFKWAAKNNIDSVALPGLGIHGELGYVDKQLVGAMMAFECEQINHKLDIKIIDTDKEFIQAVKDNLRIEYDEEHK